MGTVYRARDRFTGELAAVKFLRAEHSVEDVERFEREGQLLCELKHRNVVTYLDHGQTPDGNLYLAMEWLDGEDLAQRLKRGPLAIDEAQVLLRRIAEALEAAHSRGIIHRDIKPSNLYLRGGDVEQVVILDFGIARRTTISEVVTAPGVMIGTPGYMAPEQARGEKVITQATDIFALGCVFFECLTGRHPFAADQPLAVFARILFEEAPRARSMRLEIPPTLDALLDRMLAKKPSERLSDATALLEALDRVDEIRLSLTPTQVLRDGEQSLLSVIMATLDSTNATASTVGAMPESVVAYTAPFRESAIAELQREFVNRGAKLEVLINRSIVATLQHTSGAATDQVGRAAECALLIKARFPNARIALATGRGSVEQHRSHGEVFERAALLLKDSAESSPEAQIQVDEVSRGLLLEMRFLVHQQPTGQFVLTNNELALDTSRPLLGKPTPCVGRDSELVVLEGVLSGCVEDEAPRAVLVTAPPGGGKSRVRHEFLRRLEARGQDISILIGRGDPMSIGSSYGLIGQALRRYFSILDGESIDIRRSKLEERIGHIMAGDERRRVVVFMGELCGVPFPDADDVRLRAARHDPIVMNAQIKQSFIDFLRAECTRTPVMLVLEDLHWSDPVTVKLCETALRELFEQPFMILALARPEIDDLFPKLWVGHTQRIALRPLGKKASEKLIRWVLGDQATPAMTTRLVAQSEGNPLFLEELIRAAADGRGNEVPGSVVAMLQARIGRLDAGPRRILRMASVFGEASWRGGIRALLYGSFSDQDIHEWLTTLIQNEILEQRSQSRFSGETEYRFRHALMRDAAYGLLIDEDRKSAHGIVGAYLEVIGESDPLVLAEHYQRGENLEDAARCYIRSAQEFFDRHDLQGALRCIEAGVACSADPGNVNILRALQASSYFWLDNPARAVEVGEPIVDHLSPGSDPWCKLVAALLIASGGLGRVAAVVRFGQLLLSTDPEENARAAYIEALCFFSNMCCRVGRPEKTRACLARIDSVGVSVLDRDPIIRGWTCCAHAFYDYFFGPTPHSALRWADMATCAFEEIHDIRNQVATRVFAGLARSALGNDVEAIPHLRAGLLYARRSGQTYPISFAEVQLAFVLVGSKQEEHVDEAIRIVEPWACPNTPSVIFRGIAGDVAARAFLRRGRLTEALAEAHTACERLKPFGPHHLRALTTLSQVQLKLGQTREAIASALVGIDIATTTGAAAGEILVRIALVEALLEEGRQDEAMQSLRQTVDTLRLRMATIESPGERAQYLALVPENARCMALAKQWLDIDTIS